MAEIKSQISQRYPQASNPPISLLISVADVGAMAIGVLTGEPVLPPVSWTTSPQRSGQVSYDYRAGDTITSLLLSRSHHSPKDVALYDAILGSMDRGSFLLRSYVVSEILKRYQNNRIGIMMPALASTSLLLTGCYLAGKTPVMLNWTVGERSFAHCMEFA